MRALSKSKLLAFRQCPRRLWLEIHRPELRDQSSGAQARIDAGHRVGDIARQLYDPEGAGRLLNAQVDGYALTLKRSVELLQAVRPVPLFEAGFANERVMAFADIMLPSRSRGALSWRLIEVKSAAGVKDYHRDDVAAQAFAARQAGVPIKSVAIAHVDSSWTYPGGGDYSGLLTEVDLTQETLSREGEVAAWLDAAHKVARRRTEPAQTTGAHCVDPFECSFLSHCQSREPQSEYPVAWLPRVQAKALKTLIDSGSAQDLRDVPNELLNDRQRRVKTHTVQGTTYFDAAGAAKDLAGSKLPAYFLDFETVQLAVPIWRGTRPYQQVPFQFSVHRLSRAGKLTHDDFLQIDGRDPSKAFAEQLLAACGTQGPVFVYNAAFESARIRELAARFARLRAALLALDARLFDLMKVAQAHYYHPAQQGSWSIKKVLPTIAPDLDYAALPGVRNGGMAMDAYLEAIAPDTSPSRRAEIDVQLRAYCRLDTYAMVRIWQHFAGRGHLAL